MLGLDLVSRVRRINRDLGENTLQANPNTLNSEAGQFWSDFEVLTALNVGQDFLVNRAIQDGNVDLLDMLIVRGVYVDQPSQVGMTLIPLPPDYLHYIDAMVGAPDALHLARIYYCSDALPFLHVRHDALFIIGNFYTMSSMGLFTVGGVLNYYKRPSKIVIGTFTDSFIPRVYETEIVRYAAALLGTKEIHTQRDYKNYQTVTQSIQNKPNQPAMAGALD